MNQVITELEARLSSMPGAAPFPARLSWEDGDPAAVTLTLQPPDHEEGDELVEWVFGRHLLDSGSYSLKKVGDGDIQIRRTSFQGEDVVELTLTPPEGHAVITLPSSAVARFLFKTYAAIPAARESYDIDGAIARILEGA